MTQPVPLPYGVRDIKLIPYGTLAATAFGTTLIDLPNAQTFSFSEEEEYTDLPGDDRVVTSHGQGAAPTGSLESGGISIEAYAALAGGTIVESGLTPNRVKRYRKNVENQRPFFALVGQMISDSGGDLHIICYLCRATGALEAEAKYGEFMIPTVEIAMFPCRVTGDVDGDEIAGALYDFIQHETITAIVAPELD